MKRYIITAMIVLLGVLSVSNAYGVPYIEIVKNHGKDGVEDFLRASDTWHIEVDAFLDGAVISEDMVLLNFTGWGMQRFDSCNAIAGGFYRCKLELPLWNLGEGTYEHSVILRDGISIRASKRINFSVDVKPPSIGIGQPYQDLQTVRLRFSVTDPDVCSGLGTIKFFLGSLLLEQLVLNTEECSNFSDVQLSIPKQGYFSGEIIEIEACDRLGQCASNYSEPFDLDLKAPEIDEASFRYDIGTADYVPSGKHIVTFAIDIYDDSDLSKVTADLSAFGLSTEEQAQCESKDGKYECSWQGRVTFPSSAVITIKAVDKFENVAELRFSRSFTTDVTPPEIVFFGSAGFYNGTHWVKKKNNTMKLVVREAESGMAESDVIADLRDIGLGLRNADVCIQDGDEWTCYWYGIDVPVDGRWIYLAAPLRDRAGNSVTADLPAAYLKYDLTPPSIISVSFEVIGGLYGPYGPGERDWVQSGDMIKINVIVEEANSARLFANFEDFDNTGWREGECNAIEGVEGQFECWIANEKPCRSGYYVSEIQIKVEDFAGNAANETLSIEILEVPAEQETSPNYWQLEVGKSMPDAIDRSVTLLSNQRMWFPLKLTTQHQNVDVLDVRLDECVGDITLRDSFIAGSFIGNREPYLVIEFDKFSSEAIAMLSYNCTISIYSRKGDVALTHAEKESFIVNVSFYNLPLGAVDKRFAEHIEKLEKRLKDDYKIIKTLSQTIFWLKHLCKFNEHVQRLRTVFNVISGAVQILYGTPAQPVAVSVCMVGDTAGNKAAGWLKKFSDPLCKTVNCEWRYKKGTGAKINKAAAELYDTLSFGLENTPYGKEIKKLPRPGPYDSIWSAIAHFCLPGLIYNWNKYVQIRCSYLLCLKEAIPAGLATQYSCLQLKRLQECKYWTGQVASIVNFVVPLLSTLDKIRSILKDPVGMLRMGAYMLCGDLCTISSAKSVTCNVAAWLFGALDVWADLKGIKEEYKQITNNVCEEAL